MLEFAEIVSMSHCGSILVLRRSEYGLDRTMVEPSVPTT